MTDSWPTDAIRDRLIGDWHLYQRTGGHRSSTDDVITAWHATAGWAEPPARYLDLGCGVGSVLLSVAHRLRPAYSLGVEAQDESVTMARRAVAELPTGAPTIEVKLGDFPKLAFDGAPFDLITGSPPYFPLGTGVLPSDPQRLACRFETRGGIEDYCAVAAGLLADHGRLHVVFQTRWAKRVVEAGAIARLELTDRCDMFARSDHKEPFLSVFEFRAKGVAEAKQSESGVCRTLAIRTAGGKFTDEFLAVRRELGCG